MDLRLSRTNVWMPKQIQAFRQISDARRLLSLYEQLRCSQDDDARITTILQAATVVAHRNSPSE